MVCCGCLLCVVRLELGIEEVLVGFEEGQLTGWVGEWVWSLFEFGGVGGA